MNHTNLSKLLIYLGDSPGQLRTGELEEYIWLVEQLLQELQQADIIMRNTPINTPTGTPQ
ncbi:hypothetical protein ES708_14394 [subsurface metagenome]